MIGNTSTRGSKGAYASGNFASKKAIVEYLVNQIKMLKPLPPFSIKSANKAYHTYGNVPQKRISVNVLYFIITQNVTDSFRSKNEELICLDSLLTKNLLK